jgi:hypothetical protein
MRGVEVCTINCRQVRIYRNTIRCSVVGALRRGMKGMQVTIYTGIIAGMMGGV